MGPQAVIDISFSKNSFLPDRPKRLMDNGTYNKDVNILLGSNRDEGLLSTWALIQDESQFDIWRDEWNEGRGASMLFGVDPEFMTDEIAIAVDTITNFYLDDLTHMNIQHIHAITKMLTDAGFAYTVHDFISRHFPNAKDHSIYQYLYTHEGEFTILSTFSD